MNAQNIEAGIRNIFNELTEHRMFPCETHAEDYQWLIIKDFLQPVNGARVLDIGCAKGRFTEFLQRRGAVTIGIDTAEKLVCAAAEHHRKGAFLTGSGTSLPFAENSIDAVIAFEVLEHIPDIDTALEEIARVLKKNGKVLVFDKNTYSLDCPYGGPDFPVPALLWKIRRERSNRWMYSKDFAFKEKWFRPYQFRNLMKSKGLHVEVQFVRPPQRKFQKLFEGFPFFNPYIAWKGYKK